MSASVAQTEQTISVIIPARNEEQRIAPLLRQLAGSKVREIIVVDAASTDRTAQVAARWGARVITSVPGRGPQLNAGAVVATGSILLFVHADARLPDDFAPQVRQILSRPRVAGGAFHLRIDASGVSFRLIETLVAWRCRIRQMPYGDQAIFVKADTFRRLGGFPDYPAMEDFEFVRRLRRRGRIEIAPSPVLVSPRRWHTRGVWRTTLLNQICVAAYYLGVSPDWIAHRRNGRARDREPEHAVPERAGAIRRSRTIGRFEH